MCTLAHAHAPTYTARLRRAACGVLSPKVPYAIHSALASEGLSSADVFHANQAPPPPKADIPFTFKRTVYDT